MKRIVKKIYKNGKVKYEVQKNRKFFNLIKCNWYTDYYYNEIKDSYFPAIFSTMNEARIYCNFKIVEITKEIIHNNYESKNKSNR